jgi:Uma2 family endonuclease
MSMNAGTQISVAEYLRTSFPDGDREYVDGEVLERNMGEIEHGNLQGRLYLYLMTHYSGTQAAPATRVQVRPLRFRVPDVVVVAGRMPSGRVITEPPLLAIEVLSRDDRTDKVQVNPRTRQGYVHTAEGSRPARDGILRTSEPVLEVPLAALFEGA